MFDIQKTRRLNTLSGLHKSGQILPVPDVLCVRKHMQRHHGEYKKFCRYDKNLMFAFVSSPYMHKQQNSIMSGIQTWCHPFKKPMKKFHLKNCDYELLPESDFMDRFFVPVFDQTPKFDFFYITLNAPAGKEHKGLSCFVNSLPILCGNLKLKGLVIVYFPATPHSKKFNNLNKQEAKTLQKYEKNLTILWGWQKQEKLAEIMSSCRFGFFPNEVDCSPRIIPECLIRDRPIIVNEKIWGGWHYVNKFTGAFFNPAMSSSLESAVKSVLKSSDTEPRKWFEENYGFLKSSARLRDLLAKKHHQLSDFTNVYFSSFAGIMESFFNYKSTV